jgi:small subunit ribosomal protein S17
MFRRKKKDEPTDAPPAPETGAEAPSAEQPVAESAAPEAMTAPVESAPAASEASTAPAASEAESKGTVAKGRSGKRVQKVGTVSSDKMQKTVVVRVDRLVLHPKYRRYVRRTSKFMAHDDLGSTIGDRVRIIETRPLSARKRWRVVEIVQKAAK